MAVTGMNVGGAPSGGSYIERRTILVRAAVGGYVTIQHPNGEEIVATNIDEVLRIVGEWAKQTTPTA